MGWQTSTQRQFIFVGCGTFPIGNNNTAFTGLIADEANEAKTRSTREKTQAVRPSGGTVISQKCIPVYNIFLAQPSLVILRVFIHL